MKKLFYQLVLFSCLSFTLIGKETMLLGEGITPVESGISKTGETLFSKLEKEKTNRVKRELYFAATNTLSLNAPGTPVTISSVNNDENGSYITVMDFDMSDVGGDGEDTQLTGFTITAGAGNTVTNWSEIIADARVVNITNNNAEEYSDAISGMANELVFSGFSNSNANQFGFIPEGDPDDASVNVQLQIRLKENISAANQKIIDGEKFVFQLEAAEITAETSSSTFAPAESITSGENTIAVEVSAFNFIEPASPINLDATETFANAPQAEAVDANGNRDLDYIGTFSVSNAEDPDIPMDNVAESSDLSAGLITFPTNFNYQGSGDGTLTITDGGISGSSPTITVNPTVSLTELNDGVTSGSLESESTDQAILGFSISVVGTTEATSIQFTSNIDLSGKLSELRLVRSDDDVYDNLGNDDVEITSANVNIDGAGTTITISGLSEQFNLANPAKNYFLIADVNSSVNGNMPDLTISLNIADINFDNPSTVNKVANDFSNNYPFLDVTAPVVNNLTVDKSSISEADAGDNFIITIEYSENMDSSTEPTITFSPDVSSSLSPASSSWTGNTYEGVFTISDQNITVNDIDINVTGAIDASPNANTQTAFNQTNVFSIDTEKPNATLTLETEPVDTSPLIITQSNKTITLTANFDEDMDQTEANKPTVTISSPADANFNFENEGWDNSQQYTYSFTHNGNQEEISGATITISGAQDDVGNIMASTESGTFDINTNIPEIESITSTTLAGTYREGDIDIIVKFDEEVVIVGAPSLELALDGGSTSNATYVIGSEDASGNVTFTYTIAPGDNANPLEVQALDLNGGTISNSEGNQANTDLQGNDLTSANIVIDTKAPEIISISTSKTDGIYGIGEEIIIAVEFNEDIDIDAADLPSLVLNSGATVSTVSASGDILNFTYTVAAGENANELDVSSILSPSKILDLVGNEADLSLPTGNNLADNNNIEIDTQAPELAAANPFSPAHESFNVLLNSNFTISFDEPVIGAGTDNIRLYDADDNLITTFSGSTAFTNLTAQNTKTFNSFEADLVESTEYYFEFDEGAIVDQVANEFAGFSTAATWSFTTFGPPRIDNFTPTAICVGDLLTLNGQFFTGVSEIFIDEGGDSFEINSFTIANDNEITFTMPDGAFGGNIRLVKNIGGGNVESATTAQLIKVGPSGGAIELVSGEPTFLCDNGPAPVDTRILFNIVGGSGTYDIIYKVEDQAGGDLLSETTITNYTSGQEILVNPPATGDNIYKIVSIEDKDSELSSCAAVTDPNNFTDLTIEEFEQSVVEAGGTFNNDLGKSSIDICLADVTDGIDLSILNPSIDGSVTTGQWTIVGETSSSGGFTSNQESNSNNLEPTYYPSLTDANNGSVTLRLTSDPPTGNNPCSGDADEVTLIFVGAVSVNAGPDLNACIGTDGSGNEVVLQQLNANFGGGASTLEWSRNSNSPSSTFDGTWGFADSPNATVFTETTTTQNPYYKASPEEIDNENAILEVIPTSGGCGSGSISPDILTININDLPSPTLPFTEDVVCTGEQGVRYAVQTTTSTLNTFEWNIVDADGVTRNNQFEGATNSNVVTINFRDIGEDETIDKLIVKEINPSTGCESIADTILITIKPLPVANITYAENTTVSQGDDKILLTGEGGQPGDIQAGGVFSGSGIVQDQSGKYYLDPSILEVTDLSDPSDDIIIEFTYTDDFSCEAKDFLRFNIYAANSSFQNLQDEYCVTDESDTIYVTPSITGDDFEVIGIVGPGITEIGLQNEVIEGSTIQVFKAIFNPAEAYEQNQSAIEPSEVTLGFSTRQISNPSNISTASNAQTVMANPLPQLEFEGPEYNFCTYDEAVELTATGTNNLNTYSFTLLTDSLPSGLLSGNGNSGYEFDPASLDQYLDSIGEESIEIFMEYSYTNASGCSASDSLSFFVYKQPAQPEVENVNLCNINGNIETAVITNYEGDDANREIEWYNNESLSGDEIATGSSFTPSANFFAGDNKEVSFYVTIKNINSSGEDDELCRSIPTKVTYRLIGSPTLSWNKSSFGTKPVVFSISHEETYVENYFWEISRITADGLESELTETITDLDNKQLAVDFGNYGAGQYQVDFTINTKFRCATSISERIVIVPEDISSDNYTYNFEASNQGWVASIDPNNSWEWNTPANDSNIQTEGSFWITNASGSYNPAEQSYLYSPVMDLSQIDKPVVNFDLWVDVIDDIDGLILEYSTDSLTIEDPNKQWQLLGNFDDGISSGLNWYESTGIRSRPGTDNITADGIVNNNIFNQGWSTEAGESVEKWEAKHALSSIAQSERSNVIFRFQFKSNTTAFLPDGVAFDNFSIESLNRNVLVEYFGDEALTSDTQEMDSLASVFNGPSSMSWINYRINETDTLFEQNATAMLSRIYQYDAYEASNRFAIDGTLKQEYSFSTNAGRNDLTNSELKPSVVELEMEVNKNGDDQLSIKVDYNSSVEFSENTRLFTAVLHKEISDGELGSNSAKVYYNVLRKLLPDVEGTNLSGTSTGEIETTFTASRESDNDDLILVTFIQDVETGEIYQSANVIEVPNLSYSTVTANDKTLQEMGVQLYPNPAKEQLNLSFGNKLSEGVELKVFDLTGKLIEELKLDQGIFQYELNTQRFKTGMYNLLITNDKGEHKMLKFAITN
ncbi:T9SS type A sorting domain-containing protein [Marivirga tractuosa]|uniref:T9SS type A sorting domain-containing protein n=1 Tax=Marivirga tractuosa TaxID=1006 RepID=UPI0035D11346